MKTTNERKADHRRRMREQGYVLKHLWVRPQDWPAVREYVAERNRKPVGTRSP